MTFDPTDRTGFAPQRDARARGEHSAVVAQLVTSTALLLSIAITATVVSIGIARADGLAATAGDPGTRGAVFVLGALILTGMAGLSAARVRVRAKVRK